MFGVFIVLADLRDQTPGFNANFRLVVKPASAQPDWPAIKAKLEDEFEKLWEPVEGVEIEVVAKTAQEVTLHEIASNQFKKFDRDWISYEHDPEGGPAPEG